MAVDWIKFDYEKEVKINLDSLELDCQDNAELIMKYGKEKTRIAKELRDKKEELVIYDAKLRKSIIGLADKKMTVGEVDAEIQSNEKHQHMVKEVSNLEYDLDLLKECLKSFRNRSDMLGEERALLGMGYFSRTSKTNGNRQQIQEVDAAVDDTRNAVNRRRRNK